MGPPARLSRRSSGPVLLGRITPCYHLVVCRLCLVHWCSPQVATETGRTVVRILLVTGQTWGAEVRAALCRMPLGDGPAEVVTVVSGEEALGSATAEPFDLAVADLVLPRPGIAGAYTLIRIRELCPDCCTVLVSDQDGMRDLVSRRFDAFLVRQRLPEDSDLGSQLARTAVQLLGGTAPTEVLVACRDPDPPAGVASPQRGRLIAGKYLLGDLLGEGEMGKVYRAEDTCSHRPVALKLPCVQRASAEEEMQRILREVRIAAKLNHPSIVTLYEADRDRDDVYLVMELVYGKTLQDHLEDSGTLLQREAIDITLQILEALAYAHGQGIIHCDPKPANVLLTTAGKVKVGDFGIAKLGALTAGKEEAPPSDLSSTITSAGPILGIPPYMAREHMAGQQVDHRADLFSDGAMLFAMLHGKSLASIRPPDERSVYLHSDPRPPDLPRLPGAPKLNRVLERALAAKWEDRYESSEALGAALREIQI